MRKHNLPTERIGTLGTLRDEMDGLFDRFFEDRWFSRPLLEREMDFPEYKPPLTDVSETDREVVATIELPGVDKKDIQLNVTEKGIEVKVEKQSEVKQEDKKKGFFHVERNYSGFYRRIPLPVNVDASKADANYKTGVLEIKIPKLKIEDTKVKRIEVK